MVFCSALARSCYMGNHGAFLGVVIESLARSLAGWLAGLWDCGCLPRTPSASCSLQAVLINYHIDTIIWRPLKISISWRSAFDDLKQTLSPSNWNLLVVLSENIASAFVSVLVCVCIQEQHR